MRKILSLLLWLGGILFPMAFLGKVWPAFGRTFDTIFRPDWVHVVMHAFLYAVLGILITRFLRLDSPKALLVTSALLLGCGAVQEGLQLLTAGVWPGWGPEVFDLAVDLAGGLAGAGLAQAWRHWKAGSGRARSAG